MQKTSYAILLVVAVVCTSDAQSVLCTNCGWQDYEPSVTGTLTARPLNGVLNAASFPGSDIGAKINAAIANLPNGCGEVTVPSGIYHQTTTIIKPRCTKLHGESAFGTTLTWMPKGGTAMVSGLAGCEPSRTSSPPTRPASAAK
jgi:hypothetical protein